LLNAERGQWFTVVVARKRRADGPNGRDMLSAPVVRLKIVRF